MSLSSGSYWSIRSLSMRVGISPRHQEIGPGWWGREAAHDNRNNTAGRWRAGDRVSREGTKVSSVSDRAKRGFLASAEFGDDFVIDT